MDELDDEVKAMGQVTAALKPLDPETAKRVLDWAVKRFHKPGEREINLAPIINSTAPSLPKFKDFPELFDAADPQTVVEKALVAGYWFQIVLGQDDFESQSLNKELKHLGHQSLNITRDLDGLMAQSPRLVIQTRKSGSARQARKQYKLTTEGIRMVQKMLERENA